MKNNLQFSLLALGGAVVFVAVACVGVSRASDGWSQLLFTVALLAPLFALVRAVYVRGASRAFAVGFVALCWGYLLLAYGPWIGKSVESQLATTRLMNYLHPQLMRQVPAPAAPPGGGMGDTMMGGYGGYGEGYGGGMYGGMEMESYGYDSMMGPPGAMISIGPSRAEVVRAGHSLFALLLGFAGGLVARMSYRTGQRQLRQSAAE